MGKKVVMFVYNNFTRDARVMKEAETLVNEGFQVDVVAVLDKDTVEYETRDGYNIIRIDRDPIHYRIMRFLKRMLYQPDNIEEVDETEKGLKRLISRRKYKIRKSFKSIKKNIIWRNVPIYILFTPILLFFILINCTIYIALNIINLAAKILTSIFGGIKFILKGLVFLFEKFLSVMYFLCKPIRKPLFVIRKKIRTIIKYINRRLLKFKKVMLKKKSLIRKKNVLLKRKGIRIKNSVRKFFIRKFKVTRNKVYNGIRKFLLIFHKPLSFIDFYVKAFDKMKDVHADIYHSHDLNTLPIGHMLKKRNKAILVYDSHELYTETSNLKKSERKLYTIIERKLIKRADKIITVCDSIAEELVERYKVELPKVLMNCPPPISLDKKYNLIRETVGISSDQDIILYQGGFSMNRGLHNLIIAMKYVDKGILVLMGWGRIEEELRTFVSENNLDDRVKFIPPAPQKELLYWSSSADVGVIPYQFVGLNNYYSCPNKLFEYIGAGLPVLSSNFPELSKIILGYKLGSTFDPEDSKSIAESINISLKDKTKLDKMTENAYTASKVLNWDIQCEILKTIYEEIGRD